MSQQATNLITAEELFEMGDIGRCELIKGEIIHMAPAGAEHGDVAMEVARLIANHVKAHKLGKVFAAETGFIISRNPDTTRAPDVAFLRNDRVPAKYRRGFFEGPPDLAGEVVSPDDTHSELLAKVDQWLSAGTTSVWVVDPPRRTIDIYRADKQVERYRSNDTVAHEPLLPGFTLAVDDLFDR